MHAQKPIMIAIFFGWLLYITQGDIAVGAMQNKEQDQLRFHVVFNNVAYKAGLETGWGFSCLIEGLADTVLFDTGGDGDILLANMQRLGLDVEAVDAVVLSHIHGDHIGGLAAVLARNPDVTVYLPESFPASFRQEVTDFGAAVETVAGPRQLLQGVYSTGEMGWGVEEQALIVDARDGLVVVTGCAHPNVADMAERATTFRGRKIALLIGGFHLGGSSDAEIEAIIKRLKNMGVQKVAPSHCTGEGAIQLFRDAWGEDFIEGGLGAVIELPR
jgi:7,8-dihydropterin-6-yl-methyl-4-(beta-D-ribofuranosyl)aminobenzene 5'-phosphate synthase